MSRNRNKEPKPNPGTGDMLTPETPETPETEAADAAGVMAGETPPEPVKMVPKNITCPRCKGDGIWHTSATGRRLATIGGPVVDETEPCPNCKGATYITIQMPKEQFDRELAEYKARKNTAKAKVDADARAAKKAIDKE